MDSHWRRTVGHILAVLSDDVAEEVKSELKAGEPLRAMQVLDAMASDIRPLGMTY